jgi:hypothetical protein
MNIDADGAVALRTRFRSRLEMELELSPYDSRSTSDTIASLATARHGIAKASSGSDKRAGRQVLI